MNPSDCTIFIVDDDHAIRDAMSLMLKSGGWTIRSYADGPSFLADYDGKTPGCLVLDMAMPGMTGMEVQAELKQRGANLPILFLTGHATIPMAVQATREGAFDFLEKPVAASKLISALRRAMETKACSEIGNAAAAPQVDPRQARILDAYSRLSTRQREVMSLVVAGCTNKEIARRLGLSYRTIETHRNHVMIKMEALNLPDLVRQSSLCQAGADSSS